MYRLRAARTGNQRRGKSDAAKLGARVAKDNRKVQTAEKILRSALCHFSRDGFETASMAAIGVGAQVAHGTVFWHFGTKSRLYLEVVRRAGDQLASTLSQPSPAGPGSFRDVMQCLTRFLDANPELCGLIVSLRHDSSHAEVREGARLLKARLFEVLRMQLDALDEGRGHLTGRLDELAWLIVATISGALATRLGGPAAEGWAPLEVFGELVEVSLAHEFGVDGAARYAP